MQVFLKDDIFCVHALKKKKKSTKKKKSDSPTFNGLFTACTINWSCQVFCCISILSDSSNM